MKPIRASEDGMNPDTAPPTQLEIPSLFCAVLGVGDTLYIPSGCLTIIKAVNCDAIMYRCL